MSYGSFHLKVSKKAVRLDYAAIPTELRSKLLGFVSFDPAKHDIYQVSLAVEQDFPGLTVEPGQKIPRKMKKESYDRADKIQIKCRPGSEEIEFLGALPESQSVDGQPVDIELNPDIGYGLGGWKAALALKIKTVFMRHKPAVLNGRIQDLAQWVFFKPWIEGKFSFDLKVFCSLPKDLESPRRFLVFDAVVLDGNRVLDVAKKRRVVIPPAEPAATTQVVAAPA